MKVHLTKQDVIGGLLVLGALAYAVLAPVLLRAQPNVWIVLGLAVIGAGIIAPGRVQATIASVKGAGVLPPGGGS